MPRFFFNTRIADVLIPDAEGAELRDPDHAWEVARSMIRDLLRSEDARSDLLNAAIELTDACGDIVFEFPFNEALLGDDAPTGSPCSTTRH